MTLSWRSEASGRAYQPLRSFLAPRVPGPTTARPDASARLRMAIPNHEKAKL